MEILTQVRQFAVGSVYLWHEQQEKRPVCTFRRAGVTKIVSASAKGSSALLELVVPGGLDILERVLARRRGHVAELGEFGNHASQLD